MKEETREELLKKIANLEEANKRLLKEIREYLTAEEVMIAAGLVSKHKVEQAHDIVRAVKE